MKSYLAPILSFILFSVLAVPAAFSAPPQEPLTVTDVQGDGVVTSVPEGITCPDDCEELYKKNSTVTLTATAYPNSSFLSWQGDCAGTQLTCELKMDAPKNVTARFDTAAVAYPAPVLQTGVALPRPRFTDNLDGTVTDNATGLRWLKDVGCLGNFSWEGGFDAVADLNSGADFSCTDYLLGKFADWRVANIKELLSLVQYNFLSPPISNTQGNAQWSEGDPFVNLPVEGSKIRSSTYAEQTNPVSTSILHLQLDGLGSVKVTGSEAFPQIFLWAVRGPE